MAVNKLILGDNLEILKGLDNIKNITAAASVTKLYDFGNVFKPQSELFDKLHSSLGLTEAISAIIQPNPLLSTINSISPFVEVINSWKLSLPDFSWVNKLQKNPEIHFISIQEELNIAYNSDKTIVGINNRLQQIDENIVPLLEELNICEIWKGALQSMRSKNPDKIRHTLISMRTLLEYIIEKLAPKDQFNEKDGKKRRKLQIKFIVNKVQFGLLVDFTSEDIETVLNCYVELCDVHKVPILISKNQTKILILKSGIIIWLFLSIYKLLNQ
jgi:hypothetical protein